MSRKHRFAVLSKEDRVSLKMRLPWWGMLCVMSGVLPIFIVYEHFGKRALVLPTADATALIVIVIWLRWQLRDRPWFWVVMTMVTGLHVLLIILIPWPTGWVPAAVCIGIGTADLYAILAIIAAVRTMVEKQSLSETHG